MGVREETWILLKKESLTPGQIAKRMGVSLKTTLAYLDQMVGDGRLRRSDIFFSIPRPIRNAVSRIRAAGTAKTSYDLLHALVAEKIEADASDIEVILAYGGTKHLLGDLYEDVRAIEVKLHRLVKRTLQKEYGEDEKKWWRQGIPLNIREECAKRREQDKDTPQDPYCYSDLMDLKAILDKQWSVLSQALPGPTSANKPDLMSDLVRFNGIRQRVMHPVRGGMPSEDDFEFVRILKEKLGFAK